MDSKQTVQLTGEKLQTKAEMAEYTIPVSKLLSLKLYADTRPRYQHTADLQKGLILDYQGTELVGEGTGFGVPVVRYQKKTYFSGSSAVQTFQKDDRTVIVKQFYLDVVFQLRFRKSVIENRLTHGFVRRMAELYEQHRLWRPILRHNFFEHIGMQNSFVRAKPIGNVTVTYQIYKAHIHVKADFRLSDRDGVQKIFMLNEQSSTHFRKYSDSKGTILFDKQIGAWERIEADWASVSTVNDEVGFRLWKVKDTILHRGREFLAGSLDWVGLAYEASPQTTCLEYDIEILGSSKHR